MQKRRPASTAPRRSVAARVLPEWLTALKAALPAELPLTSLGALREALFAAGLPREKALDACFEVRPNHLQAPVLDVALVQTVWAFDESRGDPRYVRLAELLLELGANPNPTISLTCRPLEAACRCEDVKQGLQLAKVLLEYGADPNQRQLKGWPLALAAAHREPEAIELVDLLLQYGAAVNPPLRQRKKQTTALEAACGAGAVELARHLLELGADPHVMNKIYGPVLQRAISYNEERPQALLELMHLLLAQGVDIQARDSTRTTALHCTVAIPDVECARQATLLLLERGADVNARRVLGDTPLYWAVSRDDEEGAREMTALLLEHGAKVRLGTRRVVPLLGFARKHPAIMRELLALGVPVNATNAAGVTALHFAAHAGQVAAVKLLLDAGADPRARLETRTTFCARYEARRRARPIDVVGRCCGDAGLVDAEAVRALLMGETPGRTRRSRPA